MKKLSFFWLIFLTFAFVASSLQAQELLNVSGDVNISSNTSASSPLRVGLILSPMDQPACNSSNRGKIYYDADLKAPSYCNGTIWKNMGVETGNKRVGGIIVAAKDSFDTACAAGGNCTNLRADMNYTCNGSNDLAIIQKAIFEVDNQTGVGNGGAVYLLEGTFNLTGPIELNRTTNSFGFNDSGKAIIGAGKSTILRLNRSVSNINMINASQVNGVIISQLSIDGANVGSNNNGIKFYYSWDNRLDKIWVENVTGSGILFNITSNSTVVNCNVNNSQGGIYFAGAGAEFCAANVISNNNLRGNSRKGMFIDNANRNVFGENNVLDNQQEGIVLNNAFGNIFSQNNVQNNTQEGIHIIASAQNIITGNIVQDNRKDGIALESGANSNPVTNNTIIAYNYIQGNSLSGINLTNASSNVVSGCFINNNGGFGVSSGISLNQLSSNNSISFNCIVDDLAGGTGYGINITDIGCKNNYLDANLINGTVYYNSTSDKRIGDRGCVGGGICTDTKYTEKNKLSLERVVVPVSSGQFLDVTTVPMGYVALSYTTDIPLSLSGIIAGSTPGGGRIGSMLILEATGSGGGVTVPSSSNAHTSLKGGNPRTLKQNDTLSLIWDGYRWVEIGNSTNF